MTRFARDISARIWVSYRWECHRGASMLQIDRSGAAHLVSLTTQRR